MKEMTEDLKAEMAEDMKKIMDDVKMMTREEVEALFKNMLSLPNGESGIAIIERSNTM